ncbi:maleylpyruvate isomerase N-terminal domain-containing protein [Actinacidiphila glaucinigra]|uniref:maleylpyruvate isomerase N-terminal domain-containing protein n=1 Tax=Actinacidiphila glaucinigra TaxID=235986 RepID=UPI0035D7AF78
MDTSDVRLAAMHTASRRLGATVGGLTGEQLLLPSFADGWSLAQVLVHLGTGAELCAAALRRGLTGDLTRPSREEIADVFEQWIPLKPTAQRDAWQEAESALLGLLDSLDEGARAAVTVPYFTGPVGFTDFTGYWLSEQSVHTWDAAVGLDESATIPAPEVALLWDRIDMVASRSRDGDTLTRLGPRQIAMEFTDPERVLCLTLGSELHILPCEGAETSGAVSGPSEAVLRLVYGRNRPQDGVTVRDGITLDDLRALFPGF